MTQHSVLRPFAAALAAAVLAALLATPVAGAATPGELATGFGDGSVELPDAVEIHLLEATLDGGILVAYTDVEGDRRIERFTAGGELDAAWADGGTYIVEPVTGDDVNIVALRPTTDDALTILATWGCDEETPDREGALVIRLDPDGEPDSGFGDDGVSAFEGPCLLPDVDPQRTLITHPDDTVTLAGAVGPDIHTVHLGPDGSPIDLTVLPNVDVDAVQVDRFGRYVFAGRDGTADLRVGAAEPGGPVTYLAASSPLLRSLDWPSPNNALPAVLSSAIDDAGRYQVTYIDNSFAIRTLTTGLGGDAVGVVVLADLLGTLRTLPRPLTGGGSAYAILDGGALNIRAVDATGNADQSFGSDGSIVLLPSYPGVTVPDEVGQIVRMAIGSDGTIYLSSEVGTVPVIFAVRGTMPGRGAPPEFPGWDQPIWVDPTPTPFVDLTRAYQLTPIAWAWANAITTGVSDEQFAPDRSASRGQVAALLFRMIGAPTQPNPHSFLDVNVTWQNEPVAWMQTQWITTGTGYDETGNPVFSPDATITRGQAIVFIWRMLGRPGPTGGHPFVDVTASWQQAAVSWAFESGVTTGTSPTTFDPDAPVTRGDLVTLLHRVATGYLGG